jgi:hypothetical protein
MKHQAITSAVFTLIETFEFDVTLGDSSWPTRIELFRAIETPDLYRCHVWQVEHYRLQSTFPQKGGSPAFAPADEEILVEYSLYLKGDWDPAGFEASSPEDARRMVEDALLAFLDHATDTPSG